MQGAGAGEISLGSSTDCSSDPSGRGQCVKLQRRRSRPQRSSAAAATHLCPCSPRCAPLRLGAEAGSPGRRGTAGSPGSADPPGARRGLGGKDGAGAAEPARSPQPSRTWNALRKHFFSPGRTPSAAGWVSSAFPPLLLLSFPSSLPGAEERDLFQRHHHPLPAGPPLGSRP